MIAAIVFSRDRACQLELLLRSLKTNAPGLFEPLHVLWTCTGPEFRDAYFVCAEEHPEAFFVPEEHLAAQVRYLLHAAETACFFTDDAVLYRPIPNGLPPEHGLHDDVACFSLRLGRNTTFCYPHARRQRPPRLRWGGDLLIWNWTTADQDFGYAGSLDGHVFRGEDLRAMLDGARYPNPNFLEDELTARVGGLGRPLMASYRESVLVSVPANKVATSHEANRHGRQHPASTAQLNARYLAGARIDLAAMDFSTVRGAHQELAYVFA